jgi:hypothetical protein
MSRIIANELTKNRSSFRKRQPITPQHSSMGYSISLLALQEVVMRTWKIKLVCALLSTALIVTIAHISKRDKSIADHVANSPQQVQHVSPAADPTTSPEHVDTRKTSDIEPWGPVRAVDW